jgi:NADPH:quinone reductase-like Zn-dependent oxidoreductase
LILNYIVAYQTMHRSARAKIGDTVLIIGASGGIGTALMQLGALMELKMYGLASPEKHHILSEYGVIPIDYHTQDFVEVIREAELDGLDAVFDGIGGDYFALGFSLLRRGGVLVGYGNPLSMGGMLKMLGQLILFNLSPNGKSAKLYGTGAYYINQKPFVDDWSELFKLLKVKSVKPVVAAKFPLLQAAKANQLLESGEVIGNVVLLAPELLDVPENQGPICERWGTPCSGAIAVETCTAPNPAQCKYRSM